MSSDTSSNLDELELVRAQLRASEAARQLAEDRAAEAEGRAVEAEARADQERVAHVETIAQLRAAKEAIKQNHYMIEKLEERVRKLLRQRFGQSSERVTQEVDQLLFSLEDLETDNAYNQAMLDAAAEAAAKAAGVAPHPKEEKKKPKRNPLPEHLPRQNVVYPAPGGEHCSCCGGKMSILGEDVSETLEYVPGRFVVIRHVRPKHSCNSCDAIVQAPAPGRVIPRGIPGPKLLAHVAVSKFADHLPLYRQSVIYKREGMPLSRSTMAGWMGQVAWLLQPLIDGLQDYVLASPKIHSDDTTLKVLEPGSGKAKTGRLWVNVRDNRKWSPNDPPAIFFKYSPNRKAEHPEAHLKKYRGYLQADAYAGYNRLYDPLRDAGPVLAVGCWAHARRELVNIVKADPSSIAAEGVAMIGVLYEIEDSAAGQDLEVRRALRDEARIIVNRFYLWVENTLSRISAKSTLGRALQYFVNQREALVRYLDDPRLEIDNNIAENAIRVVALGRKNFLFAGADVGGDRAAAFYSLLGTAKLNDIDPDVYLADILQRIADGFPINRINELLPWNWKQGRGYQVEAGMDPFDYDTALEAPRSRSDFLYAQLTDFADGIWEGTVAVAEGEFGLRVRADVENDALLLPAEMDVQLVDSGKWVRAGQLTRDVNGVLHCELRFKSSNILKFALMKRPDGSWGSAFFHRKKT